MAWISEEDILMPNIIKCMSINPGAMEAVQGFNMAVTFGASALTRVQEEAIAAVVSVTHKCRYWAMAHGGFLREQSNDPELASHVMHDYTKAHLDPMTKGMLDFASKLTRASTSMQKADIAALRALGLNDEQILSVVLITCTFNFMTRLADGLGVEVDSDRQKAVEGWLTGPALQQDWLMKAKAGK